MGTELCGRELLVETEEGIYVQWLNTTFFNTVN